MDENDVRDNDADDEDNPGDAYGVSLGPRLSDSHQASQACHPPYGLNRCHHPSKPRKCPLFAESEHSWPPSTGVDTLGEVYDRGPRAA